MTFFMASKVADLVTTTSFTSSESLLTHAQAELIASFTHFILSEIFIIKQQSRIKTKPLIYCKTKKYSKYQSMRVFASTKITKAKNFDIFFYPQADASSAQKSRACSAVISCSTTDRHHCYRALLLKIFMRMSLAVLAILGLQGQFWHCHRQTPKDILQSYWSVIYANKHKYPTQLTI